MLYKLNFFFTSAVVFLTFLSFSASRKNACWFGLRPTHRD